MFFTAVFWPDLTGFFFSQEKTRVRSVWLVVSIIVAGGFGMYFRRSYDDQSELLDRLAAVDHLTGLLNRRGLEVRLQEELQRAARSGQPLSVLMIDVDFFKQFNDRHGHAAGDDCLIKVARCLRSQTRAEDIISRYGGEEFLIVLSNTNVCEATIVAEKLRAAITKINPLPDGSGISVTIGIASLAQGNNKEKSPAAGELIRCADSALYRGKEAGRNRVVAYA
jgi:diguanylate cyclase (GGDEF)-like protein